jgi:hypothetical protein
MLIKESDLNKNNRFISKESRYLIIKERYNGDGVIKSQVKFILRDDDKLRKGIWQPTSSVNQ